MSLLVDLFDKNYAFSFVKPCSFNRNAEIITLIKENNFQIPLIKEFKFDISKAEDFYEEHCKKIFFEEMTKFVSSGPVLGMILFKDGCNAIEEYRKLLGHTDPKKADEGTIRKIFGESITKNSAHGCDSLRRLPIEVQFIWTQRELIKALF